MSDQIRTDLEAKHGVVGEDFVYVILKGKPFVFRRPTLEEWELLQSVIEKGKRPTAGAVRQLVIDTLLEPSLDELKEAFRRWPALAGQVALKFPEMVGDEIEVVGK